MKQSIKWLYFVNGYSSILGCSLKKSNMQLCILDDNIIDRSTSISKGILGRECVLHALNILAPILYNLGCHIIFCSNKPVRLSKSTDCCQVILQYLGPYVNLGSNGSALFITNYFHQDLLHFMAKQSVTHHSLLISYKGVKSVNPFPPSAA